MFKMARRNSIDIPYANVDEVKLAYKFGSLGAFLDLYYLGARVLCTEEDFYELTMAYLTKAHENNVRHVEPFFDPQVHLERCDCNWVQTHFSQRSILPNFQEWHEKSF